MTALRRSSPGCRFDAPRLVVLLWLGRRGRAGRASQRRARRGERRTRLDGSAAAPEYYRRRRRTFYGALKYAVPEGHLPANPLDGADDPEWRAPEVSEAVDRRRVANPEQMRVLLEAVRATGRTQGPGLVALYGCMYYGMLRPSEAISLLEDECKLPEQGWGLLEFSEIRSTAGREWTDDGKVHELRKPKGGARNAVRRVPIPPVLVTMLREHIEEFGTAPGRAAVPYLPQRPLPPLDAVAGLAEGPWPCVHRSPGRLTVGP